jgi:hypothetical protein
MRWLRPTFTPSAACVMPRALRRQARRSPNPSRVRSFIAGAAAEVLVSLSVITAPNIHPLAEHRVGLNLALAEYDTECYLMCMARSHEHTHLEFVYLPLFERTRKGLLSDDDMHRLEDELLENPQAGDVEDNAGGLRKVRARIGERGKSGSARVAYLYVETRAKLYFILAFPKNVQGALTQDQKKVIRSLAAQLKKERE